MSKIEDAVAWALSTANDPSHGYAQDNRWGPDYDCSSFVITAYEQAGVPVKSRGATYTGNMRAVFLSCGFEDVTDSVTFATGAGLRRGDVLLNELSHAALALGGGRMVQASSNERGGVALGTPGDQTGREICVRSFYNFPWDCVLRLRETTAVSTDAASRGGQQLPAEDAHPAGAAIDRQPDDGNAAENVRAPGDRPYAPELSLGAVNEAVRAMQTLLALRGYPCGVSGADGDFGPATYSAVAAFQTSRALASDGICGANTWGALIGG